MVKLAAALLLLFAVQASAAELLMTLHIDATTMELHDELLVTLEMYAPATLNKAPDVSIDGLDRFRVNSQGKNLLQVPGGKTVKWILTYNISPIQDGTFKLGPAISQIAGRSYRSNAVFITVEPGAGPPKPKAVQVPVVKSAEEIGDGILLLMQPESNNVLDGEALEIRIQLLSQFPIEDLRFTKEPDFPGFLKYEFPFSDEPRGRPVQRGGKTYVAYDLQEFLLFPLEQGKLMIPPVEADIKARVPSGAFAAADLVLKVNRTSNANLIDVLPLPPHAQGSLLVGSFSLRNEILSAGPQATTIRITIEGTGQLATFAFPNIMVPGLRITQTGSQTSGTIKGRKFSSKKSIDLEIAPAAEGMNQSVLPQISIQQFDPATSSVSRLSLPPLKISFAAPGALAENVPQLKWLDARLYYLLPILLLLSLAGYSYEMKFFSRRSKGPRVARLFHRKRSDLQISRTAAQVIYRELAREIVGEGDDEVDSMIEVIRQHIPQDHWMSTERTLRKLEWNAFSQSRIQPLVYGDLKKVCQTMERSWA